MIAKTLKCLRITEFRDGRWVIPCVNSTNRDGLSFFLTTVRRAVVCDVVGTTVVIMSVKWFSVFAAATTTTLPRRRWESGGGDACARSAAPPRCIPVYTATVMRVRLPFARRPSPAAAAFRQKLCHWAPAATLKISGSPTVVGVEVCFVASVHRVRCAFFVADSRRPRPIIPVFRPFFFFLLLPFFFTFLRSRLDHAVAITTFALSAFGRDIAPILLSPADGSANPGFGCCRYVQKRKTHDVCVGHHPEQGRPSPSLGTR